MTQIFPKIDNQILKGSKNIAFKQCQKDDEEIEYPESPDIMIGQNGRIGTDVCLMASGLFLETYGMEGDGRAKKKVANP